jgi:hypothetical protein
MEFRWVAVIVLWTVLIGPVLNMSGQRALRSQSSAARKHSPAKVRVTPGKPPVRTRALHEHTSPMRERG